MTRALPAGALAGALMVAVGCAGAGGDAAPEESGVALRFGWPDGLVAEVDLVRSVRRRDPGGSVATTQRIAWRWHVEDAGEGQRLRATAVRVQDPETGETLAWASLPEAHARRVAALAPTLRLAADGRVREARAPDGSPLGAEASARVAADWHALLGAWAGRSVALGASDRGEASRRVALFGGLEVPVVASRGAGQWLPCDEGSGQARCLELEATARTAPAVAEGLGHPTLRSLALEEESYLVAEPEGLVPHYIEATRRIEVRLGTEGAEPALLEALEQRVYRLRWE